MQCLMTPYTFLKAPPVMHEKALDFVVEKYAGHVLAQTIERINELNIECNKGNDWVKGRTKELREITDFCKNMGVKSKKYKTRSYTHIPINLEGWEYAEHLCLESIKHDYRWNTKGIKVILDFKGHKTRTGVWKDRGELQVDIPFADFRKGPRDLDRFKDHLAILSRRLRHEMAHVAQTFIGLGSERIREGGLPSPDIRPDHTCHRGYQFDPERLRFKRTRLRHPLRDIEFYPRLDDEIQDFMWELRDIEDDPEIRKRAIRLILCGRDEDDSNLLYGPSDDLEDTKRRHQRYCQRQPRTFRQLRYQQPEKYQEACRKFVKALHEIDFL